MRELDHAVGDVPSRSASQGCRASNRLQLADECKCPSFHRFEIILTGSSAVHCGAHHTQNAAINQLWDILLFPR